MKNSKLDWKGLGQFMAVLVKVWTIIRQVVVRERVGLEILDWIIAEGEQVFRTALYDLTDKYKEYLLYQKQLSESVIDFNSTPVCPPGLTIAPDSEQIASRVRGKRNLSEIRVGLHLDDGQTNGRWLGGYDLKAKLEGQPVLGAQLLDFYLEHPDLIPEDWKKKGWIFFWGTIYHGASGSLYVRYFAWNGTGWYSGCHRFDGTWNDSGPAAVSASTSEGKS